MCRVCRPGRVVGLLASRLFPSESHTHRRLRLRKGGGGLMIGLTAVSGATFAAATLADSGQNVNHKC